jgi:hypothetical protein
LASSFFGPTVCTEWCGPNSQRRSSQVTNWPSPGWNGRDVVVLEIDLDKVFQL